MKKIIFGLLLTTSTLFFCSFALDPIGVDNSIYNRDPNKALDVVGIDDPLRDGTYQIVDPDKDNTYDVNVTNVDKIDSHHAGTNTAQFHVMKIIKTYINRALSMLGLIALIYLIYHGILIVTANGDDAQYKKGLKSVKYAAIALGGIALSYFVISFIFWLLGGLTDVGEDAQANPENESTTTLP